MKDRYRLTNAAVHDLDDIWDYIAPDDPIAADGFILQLLQACDLIGGSPRMGRLRSDLAKGMRSHQVGNYLIFYRVTGDVVEVLRFIQGNRNLEALFSNN